MKFAVLSDIHANLDALQAVADDIERWQPDYVIVNGDIVNRGPVSQHCWEFVNEKIETAGWYVTIGNHEEYVLRHVDLQHKPARPPMSWWTMQQMGDYVDQMRLLPKTWSHVEVQAGEFRATHASMAGTRVGIAPYESIETVREKIKSPPAVLAVGHVHLPHVRLVDETLIVNCGSVGQSCFGEKNGCYGQITWGANGWNGEIKRIPYDRAAAQQRWFESGIFEQTDLMTDIIYHEWRTAKPYVIKWMNEYLPMVKSGEADEDVMLAHFLEKEGLGRAYPSQLL